MTTTPQLALVAPTPAPEPTYQCTGCGTSLLRSAYGQDKSGPGGRRRTCRPCDEVGAVLAPIIAAVKRSRPGTDPVAILSAGRAEATRAISARAPRLGGALASVDAALTEVLGLALEAAAPDPRAAERARLEAEIAERQRALESL